MDELNTELKTQREALGLSIQDLFRRTRINTEFLEALEEGNYDVLPEAYVKLFLKRYAQEVRLEEDDIIRKFEKLHWKARVSTESFSPRGSEGPVILVIIGPGQSARDNNRDGRASSPTVAGQPRHWLSG